MIGTTLSNYEIREKLGAGGMAVVYRGRGAKLGRDVAIKVLPTDLSHDAERLFRFEREARLLRFHRRCRSSSELKRLASPRN